MIVYLSPIRKFIHLKYSLKEYLGQILKVDFILQQFLEECVLIKEKKLENYKLKQISYEF